ncbi:NUDIX domain-containing protein [Candidatus Berkiella cookevillensis]|nr:NUDIX domain-containing protein [Candidatus Berkiella cookevillensis]MCS5707534.1 NUDIX domain-containing protein [Candidatus Berkiella cookevillensis]
MSKLPWKPAFTPADVDIQESKLVYDGHYQVYELHLKHKGFNRQWGPLVVREQIDRFDAACVILFDPQNDHIVMVEQIRIGLINRADKPSPWILEIVAGLIDQDETPEQTAVREAHEEAGCEVIKLIPICTFYNTPGGFTELSHVYCGLIKPIQHPLINEPEEDEDLKIHVFTWSQVKKLRDNAWITSASTQIAVQWLEKNREDLIATYG